MAEETNPPQVSAQEHAEEKKKGTLESVIDELGSFARKALMLGAIVGVPLLYNFADTSHVARAQVTSYAWAAGKSTSNVIQGKKSLEGTVQESVRGALISYPLAEGFKGLNNLEAKFEHIYGAAVTKPFKGAAWAFGIQPTVITGRTALTYGIGKKFRENWWPNIKTGLKYLALPGALNVMYIYKFGLFTQMAVSATLSYILSLTQSLRGEAGSFRNLSKALNPFSYIGAGLRVTGKLVGNTVKGLYESVYAIGSSISDLYKSPPKPPEPAQSGAKP